MTSYTWKPMTKSRGILSAPPQEIPQYQGPVRDWNVPFPSAGCCFMMCNASTRFINEDSR